MNDPLRETVARAHRELQSQIDASAAAVRGEATCGEVVQKTDAFLIDVCRHMSAVCDVVLPDARRQLPDGGQRVKEYVRQARRLERSVAQTKGRLYGASNAVRLPWTRVWAGLGEEFAELVAVENALVADLAALTDPQATAGLAARLRVAEPTSPTRPHPNSPHTGRFAHVTRRLWTRADTFWDAAEARVVSGAAKVVKRPAKLAVKG